jgi:hypothetical protein
MGWNYQTAKNCKSVAEAFELSRRRDNLTFNHHQEAQGPEQDELLDWAEKNSARRVPIFATRRRRRDADEDFRQGH